MTAKKQPAKKTAKKRPSKKAAAEALGVEAHPEPTPIDDPDMRFAVKRKNPMRVDYEFCNEPGLVFERDNLRLERQYRELEVVRHRVGSPGFRRIMAELGDINLEIERLDRECDEATVTFQFVPVMADKVFALRRKYPATPTQKETAGEYYASIGVTKSAADVLDYDPDYFAPALIAMSLRKPHRMTMDEVVEDIWGPPRLDLGANATEEDIEAILAREDPDADDPDAPGYTRWNVAERFGLFGAAMRAHEEIPLAR